MRSTARRVILRLRWNLADARRVARTSVQPRRERQETAHDDDAKWSRPDGSRIPRDGGDDVGERPCDGGIPRDDADDVSTQDARIPCDDFAHERKSARQIGAGPIHRCPARSGHSVLCPTSAPGDR